MLSFQVSTRRTGMYRIVKVHVHEDHASLLAALDRLYPKDESRVDAAAVMHPIYSRAGEIADRDPKPHLATLMLCQGFIDVPVVVHEVVHAAALIYSTDCQRDHARASAHMSPDNETIAYLVGDLTSAIMRRLQHEGIDVLAGEARDYGE